MTTEPTWIKRSEREPTKADYPVYVWGPDGMGPGFWLGVSPLPEGEAITHWQPGPKLPAPPKPERKSLRQQDLEWLYAERAKGQWWDIETAALQSAKRVREQIRAVLNTRGPWASDRLATIRDLVEEPKP